MSYRKILSTAVAAGALLLAAQAHAEPQVEVLHWWTSGGEAKAVKALKEEFEANGGTWVDSPIAGGGGDAAMTALRARAMAGNPPTAAQVKGPSIQEWAAEGLLGDLTDVAKAENWAGVLPPLLQDVMKYKGRYVAVPVNIHRVDWIWANPAVLAKVGVTAVPKTWAEFNRVADKLKAAGITPLAHGGQPWQDATVFEVALLGVGGADFYQKTMVDLDDAALRSATMVKVFDQMRKLRGYVDPNFPGRDWNLATAMVMNGEAAFQIMGDWAKGEFLAAGKVPGKDFLCAPGPGGSYLLNTDSFIMFDVKGKDALAGQRLMAKLIVAPKFQETFNLYKGSIPARLGMDMSKFDMCAQRSSSDLVATIKAGTLRPSMAHKMAVPDRVVGAITDVVTAHFNSDLSSRAAATRLADSVAAAK